MKAGAGGAGEVRAAGQRALGLVARGREQPREGKGSRRLPGHTTTKHPHPPAPPSRLTHTLPLRTKCGSKGKRPQVSLSLRCSCLELKDTYLPTRLQEARGSALAPTSLGLSDWPLQSRCISSAGCTVGEEQIFLLTKDRRGGAHTLAFRNPSPGFSKDV